MSRELIHSIFLIGIIAFSFVIFQSPLKHLDVQIIAATFLVYYVVKRAGKKSSSSKSKVPHAQPLFDTLAATFIITTVVNATGGLSSPFFFLNYFLIFTLSVLLEPVLSITAAITLAFLYFITTPQNLPLLGYAPLFSLPFLTPFALFLGEQYHQVIIKNALIQSNRSFLSHVVKPELKHVSKMAQVKKNDPQVANIHNVIERLEDDITSYEKTH